MRECLKKLFNTNDIFILDGAMGTMLQASGKIPGNFPEEVNLTDPEVVEDIHNKYIKAGVNIIETNSFGGSSVKLSPHFSNKQIELINIKAAEIARKAAGDNIIVAGSIGPTGKFIFPEGDLLFDDAIEIFYKQAKALVKGGADIILIETMFDLKEIKAAVIGAKKTGVPVWAQMTFEQNFRTLTGSTPEVAAITLSSVGADIVGSNCGLGPEQMLEVVKRMSCVVNCRIASVANAGLPTIVNNETVFPMKPTEIKNFVKPLIENGVTVIGGCCGTSPDHIRAIAEEVKKIKDIPVKNNKKVFLCSRTEIVEIGKRPIIIGERINPTGKKKLSKDIKERKYERVRKLAIEQENKLADCLDINVGVPNIDEKLILPEAVAIAQGATGRPIVIDSSYPEAIEEALKICDGRALINSVNGKEKSMNAILPLAKKNGSMVIALLVDEDGIPETIEKRMEIADKICKKAKEYGLSEEDIVFDCLTLAVSAEPNGPEIGLRTIIEIKKKYKSFTTMGLSNVSFGLPNRKAINAAYLAMVIAAGCDFFIINPSSVSIMSAYYSSVLLMGKDKDAKKFLEFQAKFSEIEKTSLKTKIKKTKIISGNDQNYPEIMENVINGVNVDKKVIDELKNNSAMEILNNMLIPAVNVVGEKYDKGIFFLPQLIRAAKVMGSACDKLRPYMSENEGNQKNGVIILATVEGDVHDIGKNIVGTLLSNYGFDVIDLGKDVKTDVIIAEAKERKPDIVGLSALMTTTMMEMKNIINRLKSENIKAKVMIGGAVCTEDFKNSIGADYYAADAVEAVAKAKEAVN